MLAVYAIVGGNEAGWTSADARAPRRRPQAYGGFVLDRACLRPLMPLGIFRTATSSSANSVGVLMAAGMFA